MHAGGVAGAAGLLLKTVGHHQFNQRFERVDADGSGDLSFDEFANAHRARAEAAGQPAPSAEQLKEAFNRIDRNADGSLSKREVAAHLKDARQSRFEARFDRVDTDNSGDIDLDEFSAARKSRAKAAGRPAPTEDQLQDAFDRIDRDEDGALSKREIVAQHRERLAADFLRSLIEIQEQFS